MTMRKTAVAVVLIVLILLCLGIVMLASTSSVRGAITYHDANYFLKRQLIWLALALPLGYLLTQFDYHGWQKLAMPLTILVIILLVLVLVPGIGAKINGSRRWIRLAGLSFQPSEPAKFAVIAMLSAWMAGAARKANQFQAGFIIPGVWIGALALPVLLEPDFGTTFLLGIVGMAIMFVGGASLSYLVVAGTLAASGMAILIMNDEERMGRFLSFIMPDKYPDSAYHLIQSKVAFIRGEWFGVGLGNSMQKQFYLPEAHTDFILAIIGEELGFLATALVVLLFITFLICGIVISLKAPDPFGKLLAFGITMMICTQAAINVGVVTGCMPTKGLPLPFISYGGSSLLVSVACVAVLLNISRHESGDHRDKHTRAVKDQAHSL